MEKKFTIKITKVFVMDVEANTYEEACNLIEREMSAEADELAARAEPQFKLLHAE